MKPFPPHHYHIYLSEGFGDRELMFVFRRPDLLRTAALYSTDLETDTDSEQAERELGQLNMAVSETNQGTFKADISFRLELMMACGYCLKPIPVIIEDKARIILRGDVNAGGYTFVENQAFDCRELFEEEVLLRVPLSPRHQSCSLEDAVTQDIASFVTIGETKGDSAKEQGAGTWQPFANIRTLIDS